MENSDDKWGTWATGAAGLAWAIWVFVSKLFKRAKENKENKMITSLSIGGSSWELQLAARVSELEKRHDANERRDAEKAALDNCRHEENKDNIRGIGLDVRRVVDELSEVRKMLLSVVRKVSGMT